MNISGVPVTSPAPNGQGTVMANNNAFDGLEIFESAGVAAQSQVAGLVAWANAKQGVQLFGGEKVKVRRQRAAEQQAQRPVPDRVRFDRGVQRPVGHQPRYRGDPGLNQIQAALGANADLTGLCLSMSTRQGTLSLSAQGNVFAGPTDCTTSTNGVMRATSCSNNADLGIVPASGTTVNVDLTTCH